MDPSTPGEVADDARRAGNWLALHPWIFGFLCGLAAMGLVWAVV